MKQCSRCKKEKPISKFNFKIKSLGLRHGQCRECTRNLVKDHFRRNREYYIIKTRKRNAKIRTEIKDYIINYLSKHPCIDCEETDIRVLEFDHTDAAEKLKEISKLIRERCKLEIVKKEIEKCEVRCANCHRRKTGNQFGSFKNAGASVA